MNCGKGTAAQAAGPSWTDTLGVTLLLLIGIAGVYMHPLLEIGVIVYIAIAASAVWVFSDATHRHQKRWPWTFGTIGLWFLVFPTYLAKTRGAKGLIPGILIVATVTAMTLFPEMYTAKKHYKRGQIYAGQQRLTKAEEEFKASIMRDKTFGEAHLNLGILYMSQGLLDAAEKELIISKDLLDKHGIKVGPGTRNQALSLCLANLSAVHAMHTNEAIQLLDRASAKMHFEKAQKYADEALRLDPDNVRSAELVRRLQQLAAMLE